MQRRIHLRTALAVVAGGLLFSSAALAGPPLICHPFDIGGAKSLPWDTNAVSRGWDRTLSNYNLGHLVADTLALLTPQTPIIVRMETMRRATVYAQKDPAIAKELLAQLRARMPATENKGQSDPLAMFDFGYLVESYKQANWLFEENAHGGWQKLEKPNPARGFDGYDWVEKAIALRGGDPQMEFAAALIALDGPRPHQKEHSRQALAGMKSDPLLATNIGALGR